MKTEDCGAVILKDLHKEQQRLCRLMRRWESQGTTPEGRRNAQAAMKDLLGYQAQVWHKQRVFIDSYYILNDENYAPEEASSNDEQQGR